MLDPVRSDLPRNFGQRAVGAPQPSGPPGGSRGYRIMVDCGGKAQSALDKAEPEHVEKIGAIQAEADAIEKSAQAENARWKKEKERLDARCSARG
jgi:hypothetical protein